MGIFVEVISKLVPRMKEAMNGPVTLKRIIEIFVDSYHEIMLENPNLPAFVVGEIHRQPELVIEIMKQKGFDINILKFFINQQIQNGHIRSVDPVQFIASLVGMCLFPFIGKPIIKGIMLEGDEGNMEKFLEERKEFIVDFVLKGLGYEK